MGIDTVQLDEEKRKKAEDAELWKMINDIKEINDRLGETSRKVVLDVMGPEKITTQKRKKDYNCFLCSIPMIYDESNQVYECGKCPAVGKCTTGKCQGRNIPQIDPIDGGEDIICNRCDNPLTEEQTEDIKSRKKQHENTIKKNPLKDSMSHKPVMNKEQTKKSTLPSKKVALPTKNTAPPPNKGTPHVEKSIAALKRKVNEVGEEEEDALVNQKKKKKIPIIKDYIHESNPNYIPDSDEWNILSNMNSQSFFASFITYHTVCVLNPGWKNKTKINNKSGIYKQHVVFVEMSYFWSFLAGISTFRFANQYPPLWQIIQEVGHNILDVQILQVDPVNDKKLKQIDKPPCLITGNKGTKATPLMSVTITSMHDDKTEIKTYLLLSEWANFFVFWKFMFNYDLVIDDMIRDALKYSKATTIVEKTGEILSNQTLINNIYSKMANIYRYFFAMIERDEDKLKFNQSIRKPMRDLF